MWPSSFFFTCVHCTAAFNTKWREEVWEISKHSDTHVCRYGGHAWESQAGRGCGRERERTDSVKLSSATWDQVSDLLSLFSSQRWLTVISPSYCSSLSHSSEALQSPQRAVQPEEYHRNITARLSFTQFYQFPLCLSLFETHLRRLKLQ